MLPQFCYGVTCGFLFGIVAVASVVISTLTDISGVVFGAAVGGAAGFGREIWLRLAGCGRPV